MASDVSLDFCTICGGRLELVDGTDPDVAEQTGRWAETYRCSLCEHTGEYRVDETGHTIDASGSGVVAR